MPASPPRILRVAASAIVTAGLKCAPQTPASDATSSASTNACTSPIAVQSVKPSASRDVSDTTMQMKNTRRNVPTSSATNDRAVFWLHGVSFQGLGQGLNGANPMLRAQMTLPSSRLRAAHPAAARIADRRLRRRRGRGRDPRRAPGDADAGLHAERRARRAPTSPRHAATTARRASRLPVRAPSGERGRGQAAAQPGARTWRTSTSTTWRSRDAKEPRDAGRRDGARPATARRGAGGARGDATARPGGQRAPA